jgi:bifunctional DNA-binding transcriptional regulator/antitoxin component of YhaV-PrlF toxin-antitoxin module
MKTRISKGGQVSIPAHVRRRWATEDVVVEDFGDRLVLRPIPRDPIADARGAFKTRLTADEARARFRRDEQHAESRKRRR